MANDVGRRDFLKTAPVAVGMLVGAGRISVAQASGSSSRARIQGFNLQGVRLGKSRFQEQYQAARDYYFSVPNSDILQGMSAQRVPGKPGGGVFGQWLSGMSRMYRATGDVPMRDKAVYLLTEWAKTIGPDGDCRMRHYAYEKLVCGLVDLQEYGGHNEAMAVLEKVTARADKTLKVTPVPAVPGAQDLGSGKPGEYYTLPENLYRAFQISGNPLFKDFADNWLYQPFWNRFSETAAPDVYGFHAYSHVNGFSSAAMAYAVTGDPLYLRALRNAYDWLQNTQCYAPGGYGPAERFVPANGTLGRALEYQPNSCEVPCCSWAGLKMTRYLTEFTGEPRYGDWAERLIYNATGAALRIQNLGGVNKSFYYADYSVGAGVKIYSRLQYPCCSGSYFQAVAEYPNQIYYKDASSLYVNLYLPSEVIWGRPEGEVKLVQDTKYPEEETTVLTLQLTRSMSFPLKFRVPGWSHGVSVKINGAAVNVTCTPGTWATITRSWNSGDTVEIRIPLSFRYVPVDRQHPKRVAVMRGPVVMVQDGGYHEPLVWLPQTEEELNKALVPSEGPAVFRVVPPSGATIVATFQPFYAVGESLYYRMYYDLDKLPFTLWT